MPAAAVNEARVPKMVSIRGPAQAAERGRRVERCEDVERRQRQESSSNNTRELRDIRWRKGREQNLAMSRSREGRNNYI